MEQLAAAMNDPAGSRPTGTFVPSTTEVALSFRHAAATGDGNMGDDGGPVPSIPGATDRFDGT